MRPSLIVALLAALALLSGVLPSRASDVRSAAAQSLFDEARRLMASDRFSEACPKLAESQRLDPASGTLLNLAVCHEREGKTATAWIEYTEAVSAAAREGNVERQRLARQRIAEIEPKLARLRLALPERVPDDYWVEIDGVRLARAGWEADIPIDPGTHRVVTGARNMQTARGSFLVTGRGVTMEVKLPELAPAPAGGQLQPKSERVDVPSLQIRWVVTGASFGLGIAALAFGSYAGMRAQAAWDERNARCSGGCGQRAVDAGEAANELAIASNVAFGVGLAALGVGSGLLLSWPRAPKQSAVRASALATSHGAVLGVRGSF